MARGWSRDRWINWMSNEHYFTGMADYIIFKDGNYIKVKDGNTGKIAYKSKDASEAIQWAVNNTKQSSDGMYYGKIFIDSGEFIGHKMITVPDYSWIIIEGSGINSTIIKVNNTGLSSFSKNQAVFRYLNTSNLCIMDSTNRGGSQPVMSYAQYLRIANMTIDTQEEKYLTGIYANFAATLDFENLKMMGWFAPQDMTPDTSTYPKGIYINGYSNIQYVVRNIYPNGYYLGARFAGDHLFAHSINTAKNYIGIEYSPNCCGVLIKPHNYMVQYLGIEITRGVNQMIIQPSVEGVAKSNGYEYYVVDYSYENFVIYNPRHVTTTQYRGGYPDKVRWIRFGEFQNSGTATFSGDGSTTQFTIAHGLVAAPDIGKCRITPQSADAVGGYISAVDATNITVTYATAPASGTDNVVLGWEAEV